MLHYLMDSVMNNFISDQLHVAQHSRREKLRVQHCSPSGYGQQVDDYSSGLEVVQPVFNSDLVHTGDDMRNNANILYNPDGSKMLNVFSPLCNNSRNSAIEDQAFVAVNSVNLVSYNVDRSLKPRVENSLENCGVWKSVSADSKTGNWNTDCLGRYSKNIVSDISAFETRAKNNTSGHRQSQFQYGELNYPSQIQYQNALSDGVTTAVIGLQPNYNVRGGACSTWGSYVGDNEHVRYAQYKYPSDVANFLSGSSWNAEMSSLHSRTNQVMVDSHLQGLSLSLCSYPAGSLITGSQFGNSHIRQSVPLYNGASIDCQDSKPSSSPTNIVRTAGVGHGNSLQESVGPSSNYHHQTGPLGPFTGYATILKSSRFLRPAQQLLEEYCGVIGKFSGSITGNNDNGDQVGDWATAVNSIVSDFVTAGDITDVSIATQQDSDEIMKANSPREYLRSGYKAKKTKLLYMLEEVSRRYKQYYQQMQMVVSAFESVAGLAGATPYISSSLKTVSLHFNHLKSAISDQLKNIETFLGEDFLLPPSRIRDKVDVNGKRLKYTDHSFQKQKSGESNMGLLEPQRHIWRSQRGLPERAVAVLRAWLFEHFLHPYPTDIDKHMLVTQTGLTGSQVSNWFINARVRLWKPMVEEVHMLEMKSAEEKKSNTVEDDDISTNGVDNHLKADHSSSKMAGNSMASVSLKCSAAVSLYEMGGVCVVKQHDQEKQSPVESQCMSSIDERILGVSGFHQTGHEVSGNGSISLTLGLRQSADPLYRFEGSHQPPYLQQQDCMRQYLGGHTLQE